MYYSLDRYFLHVDFINHYNKVGKFASTNEQVMLGIADTVECQHVAVLL